MRQDKVVGQCLLYYKSNTLNGGDDHCEWKSLGPTIYSLATNLMFFAYCGFPTGHTLSLTQF